MAVFLFVFFLFPAFFPKLRRASGMLQSRKRGAISTYGMWKTYGPPRGWTRAEACVSLFLHTFCHIHVHYTAINVQCQPRKNNGLCGSFDFSSHFLRRIFAPPSLPALVFRQKSREKRGTFPPLPHKMGL
jgi:hypothetical protein